MDSRRVRVETRGWRGLLDDGIWSLLVVKSTVDWLAGRLYAVLLLPVGAISISSLSLSFRIIT